MIGNTLLMKPSYILYVRRKMDGSPKIFSRPSFPYASLSANDPCITIVGTTIHYRRGQLSSRKPLHNIRHDLRHLHQSIFTGPRYHLWRQYAFSSRIPTGSAMKIQVITVFQQPRTDNSGPRSNYGCPMCRKRHSSVDD